MHFGRLAATYYSRFTLPNGRLLPQPFERWYRETTSRLQLRPPAPILARQVDRQRRRTGRITAATNRLRCISTGGKADFLHKSALASVASVSSNPPTFFCSINHNKMDNTPNVSIVRRLR
jgi:hypothetical protein